MPGLGVFVFQFSVKKKFVVAAFKMHGLFVFKKLDN
jgi:hypothetical protein